MQNSNSDLVQSTGGGASDVTQPTAKGTRRATLYWRSMLIVVLLVGMVWIYVTRMPPAVVYLNQTAVAPLVGRMAPDFTLTATDGRTFTLSSLRGKPVVINFWATWCPPCRKEMPELEQLWQRYGAGKDLMLLGLDQAEDVATIEQFRSTVANVTFPILLDRKTDVAQDYGVKALPTTFFIDRNGRIQDVKLGGPMDTAMVMDGVNKIIGR